MTFTVSKYLGLLQRPFSVAITSLNHKYLLTFPKRSRYRLEEKALSPGCNIVRSSIADCTARKFSEVVQPIDELLKGTIKTGDD